MLQLYVSVGPIFYSILWQRCAYDLIRFNEKKQNKVKGWKNTMFCLKYLLWSTQTRDVSPKISTNKWKLSRGLIKSSSVVTPLIVAVQSQTGAAAF